MQKASERFDLPSVNSSSYDTHLQLNPTAQETLSLKSSSPELDQGEVINTSLIQEVGDRSPLFFDSDSFQECENAEGKQDSTGEPAWLSEFDSELVDSLRGCVNFVD